MRDIVSSSLDADKMDYLIRDAHFTGVKYGVFDLDKVIESCRIIFSGSESYLAISEDSIFAVEQLVLAKHHMTQQIYAHRIRTITDVMIVRGLEQSIKEGHDEIRQLYPYDGTKEFLVQYLNYDDGRLSEFLNMDEYPNSQSIFGRLRQRRLFKGMALISLNQYDVSDSIIRSHLMSLSDDATLKMESQIATKIGCAPWEIIIHKKSIKNPAYQAPGEIDPEAIHVRTSNGGTRMMSEFDSAVRGGMPATERLHVIGPRESNEATEELAEEIKNLIFGYVGG